MLPARRQNFGNRSARPRSCQWQCKFVIASPVLIDARTGDDNGERGEPDWLQRERGYAPNTAAGELYHLRNDLSQRDNLYTRKPEIVQCLKALLEKYKADGRSTAAAPKWAASWPEIGGKVPMRPWRCRLRSRSSNRRASSIVRCSFNRSASGIAGSRV
jgi:hypothetical protein